MGGVVNATPRPLYPRERPGTPSTGSWFGTPAGSGRVWKNSPPPPPPPGFDPRTVQPVASRYTDPHLFGLYLCTSKFHLLASPMNHLTHNTLVDGRTHAQCTEPRALHSSLQLIPTTEQITRPIYQLRCLRGKQII
jgi:hypothetical protein